MRKGFILIILCMGVIKICAQDIYQDFITEYGTYENKNAAYLYTQELNKYDSSGKLLETTPAQSLVADNFEITRIKQNNGILYFLSTPSGYWIKNHKLKQPMKISGNYKVMDVQMQDLLRIDFEQDFSVSEKTSSYVLLKKKNKKNTYSFIKIQRIEEDYTAEIYDNRMQKIKTIVYKSEILDGKKAFTAIQIYDEFIESGVRFDYITTARSEVKISKSLFNPVYMDELIKKLDEL